MPRRCDHKPIAAAESKDMNHRYSDEDGFGSLTGSAALGLLLVTFVTAVAFFAADEDMFKTPPHARLHVFDDSSPPHAGSRSRPGVKTSKLAGIDMTKTAAIAADIPAEAPACHVDACSLAYRSFRASDCTFQPYRGPRKLCSL